MCNKSNKLRDMPSDEKAKLVGKWLEEKQGGDIVVMDVAEISSVTDIMIVVSSRGVKHARALSDHILDKCAEENIEFLSMEGQKTGEWILLDLNDIIVHIFLAELREFYNLEGMWAEVPRLTLES